MNLYPNWQQARTTPQRVAALVNGGNSGVGSCLYLQKIRAWGVAGVAVLCNGREANLT